MTLNLLTLIILSILVCFNILVALCNFYIVKSILTIMEVEADAKQSELFVQLTPKLNRILEEHYEG